MKKEKKIHKVLTVILTIAIAFSVIADIVWLGIYAYEKNVTNYSSLYVGEFHSTTITDEDKAIFNINYFRNKNNTGYEVFELKVNSYMGVDKERIFGYGVQYVNPKFEEVQESKEYWLVRNEYYHSFKNVSEYTTYYNYSNNANFVAVENNLIDKDFKILFDDNNNKLYTMQFYGQTEPEETNAYLWVNNYDYIKYDLNTLANYLYEAVKSSSYKNEFLNFQAVFDVTKMFKFEEQDSFGNFKSLTDNSFIDTLKSYMTCKLNISDNGMKLASESMFEMVNGQNDFDITEVITTKDYFSQFSYYELTDNDFNYYLKEDKTSHHAVIKTSVLNNLKKQNIENVIITLHYYDFQRVNEIALNKNDIDIKDLNLLSYKLISN